MEAFTDALRLEVKDFGISVVTINPSFHRTPLADNILGTLASTWSNTGLEVREDYGQEFFNSFYNSSEIQSSMVMWEPHNVISEIVSCIELSKPPPRVIIGSDAKFWLLPLRLLPTSIQDAIPDLLAKVFKTKRAKPAKIFCRADR